jgi:hypothetical protein
MRHHGAGLSGDPTACKVTQPELRERSAPDLRKRDEPGLRPQTGRTNAKHHLTTDASCKDEARIGQKNLITRRWARRGTRPRAPHDQRTKWAYIFGAICPQLGKGAALVMPFADTEAMQAHLAEISAAVDPGAHAVLILDQAGWHISGRLAVPDNITLLTLPPRSPELNPVENVWQFMRQNWLSNRVFDSYDDIVAHCCEAWNKLADQPWRIMSLGLREWAHEF